MRHFARFSSFALQIGTVGLVISACSKSARVQKEQEPHQQTMSVTEHDIRIPPSPVPFAPDASKASSAAAVPDAAAPAKTAATYEQNYRAATDPDDRLEVLGQLRDLETAEAIQAFGRLFQEARDQNEKLDLLATLDQMDTVAGKLPILEAAIYTPQPPDVKTVAINSLAALDRPEARQMLELLTTNPNPELRETAKEALKNLAENPASTPP